MFNGAYKAITLNQLDSYLSEDFEEVSVSYTNEEGVDSIIKHPYFN